MCVTVLVEGKKCGSCGELEQALGGPLVLDEEYPSEVQAYSAFECLCWINLRETAKARGFELSEGEDPMDWRMKRQAAALSCEKAPEGIQQADTQEALRES